MRESAGTYHRAIGNVNPTVAQGKVRYLDTSGPSMARRSTRPWERRHLLSTDWGQGGKVRYLDTSVPSMARRSIRPCERRQLLSTDWGGLKRARVRRGIVVALLTQGIDSS